MKALMREIGLQGDKHGLYKDSGDNIQFCCPFHGETRPSCGINVYKLTGKCFVCDETFNLTKLVAYQMEWVNKFKDHEGKVHEHYDYNKANDWLDEKFNVDMKTVDSQYNGVIRIEDDVDNSGDNVDKPTRYETPILDLALYKSGKAVHDYFFQRGFTKETAKKFLVGWDDKRKRITVPVMWDNEHLCGIIGRAVIEMKIAGKTNPKFYKVYKKGNDSKYHIYDGFPVGDILFPLPHFKPLDGLAIIVEGQYDAMWGHQQGFPCFLSSLGSKITYIESTGTCKQIELLHELGVEKVLLLRDPDEAGRKGAEHDYKLLRQDFKVYATDYPEGVEDPQKLTKKQIETMIKNMYPFKGTKKIKRLK